MINKILFKHNDVIIFEAHGSEDNTIDIPQANNRAILGGKHYDVVRCEQDYDAGEVSVILIDGQELGIVHEKKEE